MEPSPSFLFGGSGAGVYRVEPPMNKACYRRSALDLAAALLLYSPGSA